MLGKVSRTALLILYTLFGSTTVPAANESSGQLLGGSPASPIRIEVFSDFECTACREFYLRTIRPLLQEYSSKDKVCVIYHEYPLSYHKYARQASLYSEAAARLGRQQLLAVRDSIYTDQAQWSQDGNLEAVVAKALSQEDFQKVKDMMRDASLNDAIARGLELGNKMEIKATPTMFIYYTGKQQRVEGLVTYLVMKQFLDSIIK